MEKLKELFTNLFLKTNSEESMIAWFLLGVTALLGLFLGWLLRGKKVKRLKKQLIESEQKYKLLHAENAGLEDQFKQQTGDIQEKTTRIETMEANMQSYEQNQFKLRNSLQAAQQQVEQLNKAQLLSGESSTDYKDKISAMENQTAEYETQLQEQAITIEHLQEQLQKHQSDLKKYQTENQQVEEELERLMDNSATIITPSTATIQTAFSKIDGLENRIQQMEEENRVLQTSVLEVKTESGEMVAKEDLNAMRARINILSEENKDLKKQVSGLKDTSISDTNHRNRMVELERENERLRNQMSNGNGLATGAFVNPNVPMSNPAVEAELEPILSEDEMTDEVDRQQVELLKTQKSQFGVMGDRIKVEAIETPSNHTKNDLTKIEGIGPFIEKKLNEVGITSFTQLASMDQSEIERVTAAIQFFPGRIERDNWVGQAKGLIN